MASDFSSQKANSTSDRILDAALRVFSRHPSGTATLSMIAQEAGVKVPLIVYHFKSKDNLYKAVFDQSMASIQDNIRHLYEILDRSTSLSREESVVLLARLLDYVIEDLYDECCTKIRCQRILYYELLYPSPHFDLFFEKYFKSLYGIWAELFMSITGNRDRDEAIRQCAAVFGLMNSFHIERDMLGRAIGLDDFSQREIRQIKAFVLRHTLRILLGRQADESMRTLGLSICFDTEIEPAETPPAKPAPIPAAERIRECEPDDSIESVRQIIHAATNVFSKIPAENVTLRMIANEANVKIPLLMYHFKSKNNLYRIVFERAITAHEARFQPYFEQWNNRPDLSADEGIRLLQLLLQSLMDSIYHANVWQERMLIHEILFPSEYYDYFYDRYLRRRYELMVSLIMTITGKNDRRRAYWQWTGLVGLMFGFRLSREVLVRMIGWNEQDDRTLEVMKELVLRHAASLLEYGT